MRDQIPPATNDAYASIAPWYDLEHEAFTDDLQFYRDLASGAGPTILEIGCGSGRVTLPLAEMGRTLTGVDASAAMLARCRRRLEAAHTALRGRVQLVWADARDLGDEAEGPFALCLIPLNTFAHFATPADRLAVLGEVHKRLVPGGRLALDLDLEGPRKLLGSAGQLWLLSTRPIPADETGQMGESGELAQVTHCASALPGSEPDTVVITHLYDVQAADGTLRRTISRMTLGLVSTTEAVLTLEHAGYVVEAVYGSYELDPYGPGADHAILVAHSR